MDDPIPNSSHHGQNSCSYSSGVMAASSEPVMDRETFSSRALHSYVTYPITFAQFCWFEAGHWSRSHCRGRALQEVGTLRGHCNVCPSQLPNAQLWRGRMSETSSLPWRCCLWGISTQVGQHGGLTAITEAGISGAGVLKHSKWS